MSKCKHPLAVRHPDIQLPDGSKTVSGLKPSSKWERLQPLYNDVYLELFQQFAGSESTHLDGIAIIIPRRLGASVWDETEKAKLIRRSCLELGRHNLPLLAKHVGTKSQLEVRSYLNQLESNEIDRQLFQKQTKNISQAEMPAAVEVGPECEARLEQAADALAAFQEQYDYAFGQQENTLPFVITNEVASLLDDRTEERLSARYGDAEDEEGGSDDNPYELFNVLTFIELSEKIFMHGSPRSSKDDWRALAEEGESPSVTQAAVGDFHGLIVGLLRRLVQTTLFLSQSRLRASSTKHHTPTRAVTAEDVQSALQVLGFGKDLWDYWTYLPRRAGYRVVPGSHKLGENNKHTLGYDEVEAALSVRHSSGRRRSLSVTSGGSSHSSAGSDELSSVAADAETSAEEPDMEELVQGIPAYESDEIMREGTESAEESEAFDAEEVTGPRRLSPNKRKRLLEDELDQYLENMDQQARRREEDRLFSVLGVEVDASIQQEALELGRRPKVTRKSKEDVAIWTPSYQSEWESFPTALADVESTEANTAAINKHERSEQR